MLGKVRFRVRLLTTNRSVFNYVMEIVENLWLS